MNKMIDNNKQLILTIAVTLILIIGGSFAWLTLTLNATKTNILRAGQLDLTLDDTTSDGIAINEAVPMSDKKGLTTKEYTFTLTNNGTTGSDYTIFLDDLALETTEERMKDKFVKYSLTKNDGEATTALLTTIGENPNRILETGTIEGKTTNTYTLKLWIDSNADNTVMGTIFYGQLRVDATQKQPATMKEINRTEKISAIVLQNKIAKPENTATEYDVSSKQNGGIMQYNVLNEDGETYTAYVQSDGIINAPEDSSSLFAIDTLSSLTGMENLNTSNVTNMSYMFSNNKLTTIDLSHLNTSNVSNMSYMFSKSKATALDLSSFNTSNVQNMKFMFNAVNMDTLDVGILNTKNVEDMSYMFFNSNIQNLNLEDINTSKVTNMSYMFGHFTSSDSFDFSYLDTENVENMQYMFETTNLNSLDLSVLNFENVTNADCIVYESKIKSLNLNGIKADKITSNIGYTFFNIGSSIETITANDMSLNSMSDMTRIGMTANINLKYLSMKNLQAESLQRMTGIVPKRTAGVYIELVDLSGLNAPNLTSMFQTFESSNVKKVNLSNMNVPKLTDMSQTFYDTDYLEDVDFTNTDTSSVTQMNNMFWSSGISNLSFLSQLDTSNLTTTANMFANDTNVTTVDLSGFDISNISDMQSMFYDTNITNMDLHDMDLNNKQTQNSLSFIPNKVESLNMKGLKLNNFNGTLASIITSSNLKSLDLSDASMNSITSLNGNFTKSAYPKLESVNMNNFQAKKVTSAASMFADSPATTINLKGATIGSKETPLTNLQTAFAGTTNVEELDLSSLDTSSVTNATTLFASSGAKTIDITGLNFDKLTNIGGFFAGTLKLETLNMNNTSFTGITGLGGMFSGTGAKTINMNNSNFSKVTFVSGVLSSSSSLINATTLNMEKADFSSLTDATAFFNGMTKLTSLNINGLKTGTLVNTSALFSGNTALTTIKMNSLDFSNVTSYSGMFGNLPSTVSITVKDNIAKSFVEQRLSEVGNTTGTVTVG